MPMKISGHQKVIDNIRRLGKAYPKAMSNALYKLGVVIVAGAVRRAPVEFGVLRTSAYVSPPKGEGVKANVEVGFGTKYAVPQHERLDYKHPRGGEAKYLEKSVHAVAPQSLQLLAKWIEQQVGEKGQPKGFTRDSAWNGRPVVKNSNRKSSSQGARLKRAARNVRKRTGR